MPETKGYFERVKFTFTPELMDAPVIFNMRKKFPVEIFVMYVDVTSTNGVSILEIIGDKEIIEKSLAWAREQGLVVEPVVETS